MSALLPSDLPRNATGSATALPTHPPGVISTLTVATIADALAAVAVSIGARLAAVAVAIAAVTGVARSGTAMSCRACLATFTSSVVVQTAGGSDQQSGQRANQQ